MTCRVNKMIRSPIARVTLLCLAIGTMLSAQQPDSDSGARYGSDTRYKVGPQYSASMGSVTVEDKQLFRLSLRPDIPIGKWGIAFDIELFIHDGGDFSDKGWAFGSTSAVSYTHLRAHET